MAKLTLGPTQRNSQTKIVATVGPACNKREQLAELLDAGVDVFRINTAHGDRNQHQKWLADIRAASQSTGRTVAILVDLPGPKIRLGELPGGQYACITGGHIRFVRGNETAAPDQLTTTYALLIDELEAGDRVMLADGTVALEVTNVDNAGADCLVLQGGLVRSRQGVNLPGVKLSVPTLGERDRDNAQWAAREGADFISLSFVRSASDVIQLRQLVVDSGSDAQVIAKIEKPEAVASLEQIVVESDGIMVARGDLGVEIDIAKIPLIQKKIIAACHRLGKPVIVATEMLDSMQISRLPRRAEVTDVANAILDGADACMLSGETAIGNHPVEVVRMMHRIALATEPQARMLSSNPLDQPTDMTVHPVTAATADAAGYLAEKLNAQMVVVASASGRSARTLSTRRLFVPTIGVSDSEAVLRRMCLYWGVIPLADAKTDDAEELIRQVITLGEQDGLLKPGDRIVLIAGTGLDESRHNLIQVHELK